jgi:hypothetical protein
MKPSKKVMIQQGKSQDTFEVRKTLIDNIVHLLQFYYNKGTVFCVRSMPRCCKQDKLVGWWVSLSVS